ncbi:MAG: CHASE2 domain-containing protein [Candidatus Omnitrophota bacterium]|jgi:diguanylate cyclase (GGDEF)-like protein
MLLSVLGNLKESVYELAIKYKRSIRWFLALSVALIIIILYEFDAFGRIELITLDYRFLLRHTTKPAASDIIFIDMAEDSIDVIGRWPWPRKWHAAIVKILSENNARAIAFDVIFSEPQDEANDTVFAEAIRQSGKVYLPLLYNLNEEDVERIYKGGGISSVLKPLSILDKNAKGKGHINAIPDRDGVLRRAPPIISYKGSTTYQLGLKVGLDALGIKGKDVSFIPEKHLLLLKKAGGNDVRVPLDKDNQLIVNWKGKWGMEFPHYSYIDVIRSYSAIKNGKKPIIGLEKFKDKICIIGLTASGLMDIKPIPLQNAYPAVGVNAMVAHSVLNNDFIYDLPGRYNMLLIIIISVMITLYLSNLRLVSGMLIAFVSMAVYTIFSFAIFDIFNVVVSTFYPIVAIFVSYSITSIYTQILQTIERAHLFKQATRDGLTYLYNIRHFNLLFEAEFRNVSLYKSRRLSLIMADIDNFKHINDTYGHPAGDIILKEVAKTMQMKCRQIDVVARYGGEEFIVMLTGAGEKEAFDVADKIRAAVESKKFKFKNDTYFATISLGVSEFSGEKDKGELIEKADKALYKSKHEGKNRVSTYSSISAV